MGILKKITTSSLIQCKLTSIWIFVNTKFVIMAWERDRKNVIQDRNFILFQELESATVFLHTHSLNISHCNPSYRKDLIPIMWKKCISYYLKWIPTTPHWTLLPLPGMQVLFGSEVHGWMFWCARWPALLGVVVQDSLDLFRGASAWRWVVFRDLGPGCPVFSSW